MSEQSNKALLEELVRLQGELKGSIRRNEDTLREEREERLVLSEKIRAANNLYTQMTMRVARAEEKIESEHNTVGTLVNHTKQVEQALMGNQQQLLSRREQIHVHVERVKDDIDDMRESQEQLQKNMRALTDDVRTMKSKHEVQTVQFGTVVQEIRQRVKKIEGDTNSAVSALFCTIISTGNLWGFKDLSSHLFKTLACTHSSIHTGIRPGHLAGMPWGTPIKVTVKISG